MELALALLLLIDQKAGGSGVLERYSSQRKALSFHYATKALHIYFFMLDAYAASRKTDSESTKHGHAQQTNIKTI
jgi:hypothetical protein